MSCYFVQQSFANLIHDFARTCTKFFSMLIKLLFSISTYLILSNRVMKLSSCIIYSDRPSKAPKKVRPRQTSLFIHQFPYNSVVESGEGEKRSFKKQLEDFARKIASSTSQFINSRDCVLPMLRTSFCRFHTKVHFHHKYAILTRENGQPFLCSTHLP